MTPSPLTKAVQIRRKTVLASLWTNNETGTLPTERIRKAEYGGRGQRKPMVCWYQYVVRGRVYYCQRTILEYCIVFG